MITENLPTLKIYKLTQEQYNQRLENGQIDENALYLTPEEDIDLSGYATVEQVNEKADKSHTHDIADINNLQPSLDSILEESKSYVDESMSKVASAEHNHNGVYDISGSAQNALISAKSYTDEQIREMVGNNTVATQITSAISSKADIIHDHNDVYDLKGTADSVLEASKEYTDNAIAQASQIQIITWGVND